MAITTPVNTPTVATVKPTVGTARIPLDHPNSVFLRIARWWSTRKYGAMLEPALAALHNRKVLTTMSLLELSVPRWSSLDPDLRDLAEGAVSAEIGCSWCIDFGYFLSRNRGMDPAKLEALADWRASDVYTPLERQVLEYAEAMTSTPPTVTDEMVEGLRASLSDEQLVELTAMIAVENLRSRTNAALGLTSQGFKAHCEVPNR
ncbi:carboxymuconolactone decarboxylase family protein [Intrasporangium sp.]|uniref:carboxymuconolactone decarboxylase family protein n=1 Tax=Intrasporangium sp. TaxID=1925024 RepID=UPI00293AC1F8|nr:carboxymuconolactone decarboxylase family protein [Intrasporangium sp.]MDV3223457.1 carboxymuconolactone decarboxylase family protein [Intrasporangium sp.]